MLWNFVLFRKLRFVFDGAATCLNRYRMSWNWQNRCLYIPRVYSENLRLFAWQVIVRTACSSRLEGSTLWFYPGIKTRAQELKFWYSLVEYIKNVLCNFGMKQVRTVWERAHAAVREISERENRGNLRRKRCNFQPMYLHQYWSPRVQIVRIWTNLLGARLDLWKILFFVKC